MNSSEIHKKVKVLVVDDSLVMQRLYRKLIDMDGRFEYVGSAANGKEAIEFISKFKPDIVSMDINMPLMNGVDATRSIMQQFPVPIVIVSSLYNPAEQDLAMKVLEAGAVSIMMKPHGPGHPKFESSTRSYLNRLYSMSEVKVVRRNANGAKSIQVSKSGNNQKSTYSSAKKNKPEIIVIGASAGGPEGVKTILANINPEINVPVLIVQHIDSGFAEGYVNWLNTYSNIPVKIVDHETEIQNDIAYLPTGDKHLVLKNRTTVKASDTPPVKGHRPAVAELFSSTASIFKEKVLAVILSGMGADGAAELKLLKDLGAFTIAQSEKSCLVFGMPGVAIQLGGASRILDPLEIAKEINSSLLE